MGLVYADPKDPLFKDMIGASVFWELADEVDHASLCMELESAGIEHYPPKATDGAALLRYLTKRHRERDKLVKPAKHPLLLKEVAYGVFVRSDQIGAHNDGFELHWTVGLKSGQDGQQPAERLCFSWGSEEMVMETQLGFTEALETLGGSEQSAWLTAFVKNVLKGIPFANGAGQYFIGPDKVPAWRQLKGVLAPFGIVLHEIPAMRSEQAVSAVLASLKNYVDSMSSKMEEELDKYETARSTGKSTRDVQARVVESRTKEIDKQLELVRVYEDLFDTQLTEIREGFDTLKVKYFRLRSIAKSA